MQTQADWTNQVYSSGIWILQTGGAPSPSLQRFILTNEAFEDTAEFAEAKYISVHALGGGDFINYQFEKVGDTIQVYGNPLTGDQKASFGIYEIEEITEHNFPDDPNADGADFSDAFVAYTVKPLASQGIVEPNEMCQIKTMPPVGAVGGGAETHVGENPPADAKVGDLWYCTKLDDLTLYVLAEKVEDGEDVWAAAAPPVSLDGVREDMQNIDNTLSEVRATLFAVDNDVKALKLDSDETYVSKYGNNTVEPDGGEWRIQGANKTFIKVDTNNGTCGVFNLQTPSADHHAISRGYVKENAVLKSGTNKVSNDWKIQGPEKTHFHVENNETKIYWLQDPSHAQHPVTMGWADNKYAQASNLSSYLPVAGGTLTGNLQFSGGARIDCNNGNTVLSGRGCFEIRATSDKPLIFSSGSGANRLLSFYGFDSGATDKRSEKAYITAGGEARFNGVYSKGKELATKEYVDANAGGSSEGAIAKSGTNTNPTLAKGELYLCTTDNTLRVGI